MDTNRAQKTHKRPACSPTDSPTLPPTTRTNNPPLKWHWLLWNWKMLICQPSSLTTLNTSYAYGAGQLITAPHFRQRLGGKEGRLKSASITRAAKLIRRAPPWWNLAEQNRGNRTESKRKDVRHVFVFRRLYRILTSVLFFDAVV